MLVVLVLELLDLAAVAPDELDDDVDAVRVCADVVRRVCAEHVLD